MAELQLNDLLPPQTPAAGGKELSLDDLVPPRDNSMAAPLKGAGDMLATGAENLPHGLAHGLEFLGRLIFSNKDPNQTPLADKVPQAHLGPEGQQLAGDIGNIPGVHQTVDAARQADSWLQQNAPTFHKALHGGLATAGAIGEVAAPLSMAKEGISALTAGDATPAVTAAVEPRSVPGTTENMAPQHTPVASFLGGSSVDDAKIIHNQQIGDAHVARVTGHDPSVKMTPDSVMSTPLSDQANAVYNRVANSIPGGVLGADQDTAAALGAAGREGRISTGTPNAAGNIDRLRNELLTKNFTGDELVNEVRGLRRDGFRSAMSEDTDEQALGHARLEMADALDDHIERNLPPGGDVSIEQYRGARQQLAQNATVSGALDGAGHIDMSKLAKLDLKKPGMLSGPLKDLATFAGENPNSTRLATKVTPPNVGEDLKSAISLTRPVGSTLEGLGGAAGRKMATGNTARAVQEVNSQPSIRGPQAFDPIQPRQGPSPVTQAPTVPFEETPGVGRVATSSVDRPASGGDIPLSELLGHGVEQPAAPGLSLADDLGAGGGRPSGGVDMRLDPSFMSRGLSLADDITGGAPRAPTGDVAEVGYGPRVQGAGDTPRPAAPRAVTGGVPDGTMTRTPKKTKLKAGDVVKGPGRGK